MRFQRDKNGDGLSFGEFVLRSNYRLSRVNMLIQVSTLEKTSVRYQAIIRNIVLISEW